MLRLLCGLLVAQAAGKGRVRRQLGWPSDSDADRVVETGRNNLQHIINGGDAVAGAYPWYTLLRIYSACGASSALCGGSLISPTMVLTAAHCVAGAGRIEAWVGSHSVAAGALGTPYTANASCITPHPGYDSVNNLHDVAVIALDRPAPAASVIVMDTRPAAELCQSAGAAPAGCEQATIVGFGSTTYRASGDLYPRGMTLPTTLQAAVVELLDYTTCRDQMQIFCNNQPQPWAGDDCTLWDDTPRRDATTQICTAPSGGRDSCQGDSGGPMAGLVGGEWTLIGAVQWGYGCGGETPAVYTHVQSYADWIADVVHQGCSRRPAISREPLTCGAAVTGATSGEPQPDTAYSFEAVSPGTYTFDACGVAPVDSGTATAGVAGGLNLHVYPLHADGYFGELIRAERGNHGCAAGTDGARVTVLLPPGNYALAIEPATTGTAGVYQLAMSCGGSGDSCADDADVDPAEIGGEACGYWLGRNCVHSTGAYYGLTAAEGATLAQRCPYSCGTCDTPQIQHGDRVYGSTCTGRSSATLQFTVPSALHVVFDGCESELDTIVSVYRGAELVARNDDHCDATRASCYGTCVERSPAAAAVGSASASYLRVPLVAGSYTVVITGYEAGVLGRYALSMRFDGDADITVSPTTSPTHPPPTMAPSPPTYPPTAAPAAACPASHLDSSTRPGQSGQLLNRIVGDISECIALCSETELCITARYRESDRRCQVYQASSNRVNCGSGRVCCIAQVDPPSAAPSAPPTRSPIADIGVCATGCRRGNRPLASLYTAEGRQGADGGGGEDEVRYRLRSVGNCDGYSFIDAVEQCAAAAVRLGLGDVAPLGGSLAVDPYGCFFKASEPQPGLYFNANGNRNDDDITRVSLCRWDDEVDGQDKEAHSAPPLPPVVYAGKSAPQARADGRQAVFGGSTTGRIRPTGTTSQSRKVAKQSKHAKGPS